MRVLAHRGASGRWPEHTRAAYVQALADGAGGLECDVRLTADGVPVCWHDADVGRTSDGTGPVRDHTLAELRLLDVMGGVQAPTGAPWDGPAVLTLAELVELALGAGRPLVLAIELKHPSPDGWDAEDAVLAVLGRAGWVPGRDWSLRISLMSFHPGSLLHLRRSVPAEHLMPLLDVGDPAQLALDIADLPPAQVAALALQARELADAAAVGGVGPSVAYLRAHPDHVAAWHGRGVVVRVWTVDTLDDLEACRQARVDEVTTNEPAAMLSAIRRPGHRGTPPEAHHPR